MVDVAHDGHYRRALGLFTLALLLFGEENFIHLDSLDRLRCVAELFNDQDYLTAARVAEATIDSIEKQLSLARLQVEYCVLRAPEAGAVSEVPVEVNENVNAGTQVAAVSCGDEFEVRLDLPESLINRVDRYTPVTIRFGSIPGFVFSGEITEVATAIAPDASAFPVVVKINEQHPALRSGLAADVTFQFDSTGAGGGIVRAVAERTPDCTQLERLDEPSLRDLFAGPDRIFHLREDGARELHRRTGGLPSRVAAEVERHLSGETEHYVLEHQLRCKDGSYRWIAARGKLIHRTANGEPLRFVGTHTDITERKQQNAELQGMMRAIDRAQAVVKFDLKGTVLDANENFLSIFGYSLDEVVGKHHRIFCEASLAESAEYREFGHKLSKAGIEKVDLGWR